MTERGTMILETGKAGDSKPHDQAAGQSTEPTGLRSKVAVERLSTLAGTHNAFEYMKDWSDEKLNELSEEVNSLPEIKEYQKEAVRSDVIREVIAEAKKIAIAEGNKTAGKKAELADQLLFEFLSDINKYVRIINHFEQMLHIHTFRMDEREYRTLLSQRDHDRHIAHNNLMSSVLPLSRVLNLQFLKTLSQENVERWEEYLKPRWFSLEQIKNRDFMEKWAVNTDAFEMANEIQGKIAEIRQARKGQEVTA